MCDYLTIRRQTLSWSEGSSASWPKQSLYQATKKGVAFCDPPQPWDGQG